MGFADKYLQKIVHSDNQVFDFNGLPETPLVVIIPAYDEPEIDLCIRSLMACDRPDNPVLVLVLFNSGEMSSESVRQENRRGMKRLDALSQELSNVSWFYLRTALVEDVRKKKAGVGFARKTLMDHAVGFFNGVDRSDGLIASLDADCTVSPNYLMELSKVALADRNLFYIHYFEHPIDSNKALHRGIVDYELHLRYYAEALKSTGFPYAFHTVGSAFSVRAEAYVKQGGMNDRKAGEDFYFLHKLTHIGTPRLLSGLTVYPCVRLSDRVPFGTGPMLRKWNDQGEDLSVSYPLVSFRKITTLFDRVDHLFVSNDVMLEVDPDVAQFMNSHGDIDKLSQLRQNCSTSGAFRKRFFHLFDAFWVLKCLNFLIEHGFCKDTTLSGLISLGLVEEKDSTLEALQILRKREILENK
ncbi:hypothetical protein K5X82_15365 [Halosquirtibacter xylanolyticus]|uniref:glycosyltransferase n=1 Tax=Halosquirtibacter xylanolyticus TaxID=3374599 RepID=UPI0037485448|nr:hypothetical protein K5X82_15365 [Prolixibacteraceae bacterium]